MKKVELRTERLLLRAPVMADVEQITAARQDPTFNGGCQFRFPTAKQMLCRMFGTIQTGDGSQIPDSSIAGVQVATTRNLKT